MTLGTDAKNALSGCARAIAWDVTTQASLFDALMDCDLIEDALPYLAAEVEKLSDGKYTVRQADFVLFAHGMIQGPYLYAARVPTGTPEGKVMELTGDMFLVGIGPYDNGLKVRAREQQSREIIESVRAARAINEANFADELKAEEAAKKQVHDILRELIVAINNVPAENSLRNRLAMEVDSMRSYGKPPLQRVIIICNQLGVNFSDIVRAALD